MAGTKHSIISTPVFFIVWGISQATLKAGIVGRDSYRDLTGEYMPLDQKLLPLLDAQQKNLRDLGGIAVVADALGGFASSRLILGTLNVYAWLRKVPIIPIPAVWEDRGPLELSKLLQREFHSHKTTGSQVLPAYQHPADTTMSRKKKRFTVV